MLILNVSDLIELAVTGGAASVTRDGESECGRTRGSRIKYTIATREHGTHTVRVHSSNIFLINALDRAAGFNGEKYIGNIG
jgi:hypothetical protein